MSMAGDSLTPDQRLELARDDPDHLRQLDQGWSWIELWGGPLDGRRYYHIGPPLWQLKFLDPQMDTKDYIEGATPLHIYVLEPFLFVDGSTRAMMRYKGAFK